MLTDPSTTETMKSVSRKYYIATTYIGKICIKHRNVNETRGVKRLFWRPRHKWKHDNKINFKEIFRGGIGCIILIEDIQCKLL
jgi:hypothetical protein